MRLFVVFCLALMVWGNSGLAERRVGLVIGNDTYTQVPKLAKARADAQAVTATLQAQGFEIFTALDATRREMNREISRFTGQLQPGDTAFLFFAGHGVEIDGENYLLPTDIVAPASGERDFVKSESIALSSLLDRIRATGARTNIAVIDACRNNPFESAVGRSIGRTRGLGRITAPQGTFVIFSAGAGQLALDQLSDADPEENSVFTRALLPRMRQPGLELRAMMSGLRRDVRDQALTVSHNQVPAYYDELLGEFYFSPPVAATPKPKLAVPTPTPSPAPDTMRSDFDLARSIGTVGALQAFLDQYPTRSEDFTYQLAAKMLADMSDPAEPSTPLPLVGEVREAALAPKPDPTPIPTPAPAEDTAVVKRTLIRDTQRALNRVGCNAGGADGVIGRRTRQAFDRFVAETDSDLKSTDLGTERALKAVQSAPAPVCKAAPVPPTPKVDSKPSPQATPAPAQTVYDMSGTWRYSATCRFGVKVTGSVKYSKTGANSYSGRLQDSLGQQGSANISLSGNTVTGTYSWPWGPENFSVKLSSDGQSYSGRTSVGCRFFARR